MKAMLPRVAVVLVALSSIVGTAHCSSASDSAGSVFGCGDANVVCRVGLDYCDDRAATASCVPLPAACGTNPTCACIGIGTCCIQNSVGWISLAPDTSCE